MVEFSSINQLVSSRAFSARQLKAALVRMPSSQAQGIRKMARRLDRKTGIGYYACLDAVATIGVWLKDVPSSRVGLSSS